MPKKKNALIGMHPEAVKTLEKLGHRLRANRIAQGCTVQQMADRLFFSPNTYRVMEAGKPSSSVGIIVSALWLFEQIDTLDLVAPIPIQAISVRRVRKPNKMFGVGLITEEERDF